MTRRKVTKSDPDLPFSGLVLSALTRATMDSTDSGEGMILCEDTDDMFRKPGI
ncbi:MAG: hypothetical protein R6V62_06835 [Candidatus Fermentibacteraceae bacterium]